MKGVVTEPGCCVQVFPDPDQDLLAAFNKKVAEVKSSGEYHTPHTSLTFLMTVSWRLWSRVPGDTTHLTPHSLSSRQ